MAEWQILHLQPKGARFLWLSGKKILVTVMPLYEDGRHREDKFNITMGIGIYCPQSGDAKSLEEAQAIAVRWAKECISQALADLEELEQL